MVTHERLGFLIGLILLFTLANCTDVSVKGPSAVITGDYEKFTCQMEGDDVTEKYGQEWKFRLKSGEVLSMNETDTLTGLETRKYDDKHTKLEVTSFLRMGSANILNVICYHSPKLEGFLEVEVKDLTTVTEDENPCTKSEQLGTSVTSIYIPPANIMEPSYRKYHYISDQPLKLNYANDATQMLLICHSPSKDLAPYWSFSDETASKMKFAVWGRQDYCKRQVLHIYQIAGKSGEVTSLKFDCSAQSKSTVYLDLTFPLTKSGSEIDFLNSTESCISTIVDKYYNKELTGVGVASSVVIILMMVGIAVMKKRLNQQQSVNRELLNKNTLDHFPPAIDVSGTEQLNTANKTDASSNNP